ncbi:YxlC family protein [Halobacillus salinarum]|uniref:YxlC family protein n=1 Tax=Halobacillus salinarum TaxID=2932257 RepID=A0ABY4EDT0_9BACI|nr:YxlC family protein [Halobacillus salinarum]UOQ42608.1 YxlC family protein [Halobacillus salinarum]
MGKDKNDVLIMLRKDWNEFDQINDYSPSKQELLKYIVDTKLERKKAFFLEFGLFLFTAFIILAGLIMSVLQAPVAFLVLQAVAAFILPVIFFRLYKNSRQKGDVRL